jgi:hypothetical protein
MFRVQQSICDGHLDFVVTGNSWPAFLYPHAKSDPDDFGKGLFKSVILLKVHLLVIF